jgi:hypothetical protein
MSAESYLPLRSFKVGHMIEGPQPSRQRFALFLADWPAGNRPRGAELRTSRPGVIRTCQKELIPTARKIILAIIPTYT